MVETMDVHLRSVAVMVWRHQERGGNRNKRWLRVNKRKGVTSVDGGRNTTEV
jgi:hypothetical protein